MAFPNHPFSNPASAREGAWQFGVALISRVDLTQPHPKCMIEIASVFEKPETATYLWIREALGYMNFSIQVYSMPDVKKADFDSYAMFITLGYRGKHGAIEAEFHPRARLHLQYLQSAIHELYQQNMLTPSNLTAYMRALTPLTSFNMDTSRGARPTSQPKLKDLSRGRK
ncbi:hypothetical protein [Hymenobacter daeguensis]